MKVLALKYRPKTLDDLVGQPIVVQTLKNAITHNRLHHAYLFVGTVGTGKTTSARVLAAMENCKVSPGLNPCGSCSVCQGIFDGNHNDIVEIDAASNAGSVEQIRELKNEALYNPTDGARTNYFILDEAHKITSAGNDALLKILEEPPARTRFILCTTDVQKLKPAIISRCQRHDFVKIFWMQIAEHLTKVIKEESLNIDVGAINLCARMAKGSMRNALNNLDHLISLAGKDTISTQDAEKLFGTGDGMLYFDLIDEAIGLKSGKPDTANAFKIINQMLRQGAEYTTIANGIAEHLQTLLIGLTSSKAGEMIYVTGEGKDRLKEQLKKCQENKGLTAILKSVDRLSSSNVAVGYGILPEMALQKWFIEALSEFKAKA